MLRFSRKSSILILPIVLLSCHTAKHTTKLTLPGNWPMQAIVVDGYNKDWPSPYPNSDNKAMISYAMANDAANLYITMETGDPKTQLKIIDAGMTVWIDTSGTQNRKTGINYPMTTPHAGIPAKRMAGEHNGREGSQDERLQMRAKSEMANAQAMALEGFKGCNASFKLTDENACGIKVRMAIDSTTNNMVWEASIPFKALFGRERISNNDAGRPISICFNINGFEMPERFRQVEEKMKNDTVGKMNQRFAEMKPLFEPTVTWKQFGLAYKQQ